MTERGCGARRHLLELTPDELGSFLVGWGEPEYRADQIFDWVFRRAVADFSSMGNLPAPLRSRLEQEFVVRAGRELDRAVSSDGTVKLLIAWEDRSVTSECVMIPAPGDSRRRTACVSSQVGCDVGCRFCASGLGGALRNLTVGEIVEQAVAISGLLLERGERLTHVVFMGMGEPLANYRATVEAVRRINADWGLGIAQRRISVSTVGLPGQIVRLADEGLQVTLALSLHSASEEVRAQIIPWARRLRLADILSACRTYFERTGREITLEYCLLADVNDRGADVESLARVALELRAHVNLLMYNPIESLPFARPSRTSAMRVLRQLRGRGVRATLRESRGLEADAACGQLRRRHARPDGSS